VGRGVEVVVGPDAAAGEVVAFVGQGKVQAVPQGARVLVIVSLFFFLSCVSLVEKKRLTFPNPIRLLPIPILI
jgi:hypothetical protein